MPRKLSYILYTTLVIPSNDQLLYNIRLHLFVQDPYNRKSEIKNLMIFKLCLKSKENKEPSLLPNRPQREMNKLLVLK